MNLLGAFANSPGHFGLLVVTFFFSFVGGMALCGFFVFTGLNVALAVQKRSSILSRGQIAWAYIGLTTSMLLCATGLSVIYALFVR